MAPAYGDSLTVLSRPRMNPPWRIIFHFLHLRWRSSPWRGDQAAVEARVLTRSFPSGAGSVSSGWPRTREPSSLPSQRDLRGRSTSISQRRFYRHPKRQLSRGVRYLLSSARRHFNHTFIRLTPMCRLRILRNHRLNERSYVRQASSPIAILLRTTSKRHSNFRRALRCKFTNHACKSHQSSSLHASTRLIYYETSCI
jgi:hypothetical protein